MMCVFVDLLGRGVHSTQVPVPACRLGDMVFSLMAWYLPMECNRTTTDNSSDMSAGMQTFDCDNAEKSAPDLVVTKLSLEMDSRTGLYQECNVCHNGQDPMSAMIANYIAKINAKGGPRRPIPAIRTCAMTPIPEYICGCAGQPANSTSCDSTVVGTVPVAKQYQSLRPSSSAAPATDWWSFNLAQKLGGTWYSTPDRAHCVAMGGSATAPCSWRATPIKRVSKQCHAASMANSILATASTASQACFSSCRIPVDTPDFSAASGVWPRLLPNAPLPTDPCWLRCIFELVLTHGDPVAKLRLSLLGWERWRWRIRIQSGV